MADNEQPLPWTDWMMAQCRRSNEMNVLVMFIRRGDDTSDTDYDVVFTNATGPDMVQALANAINGEDADQDG